MSNRNSFLVNDILLYMKCMIDTLPKNDLCEEVENYYTDVEISNACLLLEPYISSSQSKDCKPVEVIYNHLKMFSHSSDPKFLCKNVSNWPSFSRKNVKKSHGEIALQDLRKENTRMKLELCGLLSAISEIKMMISKLGNHLIKPKDIPNEQNSCLNNNTVKVEVPSLYDDEMYDDKKFENSKLDSVNGDIYPDEYISMNQYLDEHLEESMESDSKIESIVHQVDDDTDQNNEQVIVVTTTSFGHHAKIIDALDSKDQDSSKDIDAATFPDHSPSRRNFQEELENLTDPERIYVEVNGDGTEVVKECPKFPKVKLNDEDKVLEITPEYSCSICGSPFELEMELIDHMTEHSKSSVSQCYFCNFRSHNRNSIINHLKIHESSTKSRKMKPDNKYYKCVKCDFRTTYQNKIRTHVDLHFEKLSENCYQCQICQKKYKEHATLRKHRMRHAGVRPFICKICGANFFLKAYLTLHIRYSHKDKPFQCSYCSYRFSQKSTLVLHERTHTGEKPYKCDRCNYKAVGSKTLLEHQRNKHTEQKPFECSLCGKGFHVESRFMKHLQTHTDYQSMETSTANSKEFICAESEPDDPMPSIKISFTPIN